MANYRYNTVQLIIIIITKVIFHMSEQRQCLRYSDPIVVTMETEEETVAIEHIETYVTDTHTHARTVSLHL
jgi:hypothetical protein